ncbi:MAG: tetraacyldisaccharide 4'-kinase [Rikenellaceae bacterium]
MLKTFLFTILAGIYSMVINIRHWLFDIGVLKSKKYDIPIICIGNITVGGTGKTPMTEMIVSYMSKFHKVAVISRGYGRKTKGYLEVSEDSHYRDVGDEPLQIKLKFPEAVVVVCEKRVVGIDRIIEEHPDVTLVIMDDGFQHRYVEPAVNIVMIDATRPPHDDKLLPLGSLRESLDSLHRAHYFIVSKCPENMKALDRSILRGELIKAAFQEIYFTRIESFKPTPVFSEGIKHEIKHGDEVIALSGIGNPATFVGGLEHNYKIVDTITFDDHHVYKVKDLKNIINKLHEHPNAMIVTTEKDAVKMIKSKKIDLEIREKIFYTPINISFIDDSKGDLLSKLKQDVIEN